MIVAQRRTLTVIAILCFSSYALLSLAIAAHWLDSADLRLHAWVVHNMGPDFLGISWTSLTSLGSATVSTAAVGIAAFFAWRAGAARTAVVIIGFALAGGLAVDGFKTLHERPYPAGGHYEVASWNSTTGCPENARCDVGPQGNASIYCPPGSRCNFYFVNGTSTQPFNATFIPADLESFPTRPGRAYPSGHTMGATLSWGVALLLGLRAVQRRRGFDPWAVGAWAAIAFVGGISRIPVYAHWWTDVVGAWLLGASLLALAILVDGASTTSKTPSDAG